MNGRAVWVVAAALAAVALLAHASTSVAQGTPSAKVYPEWKGQWARVGSLDWPPEGYRKAGAPPLTAEYEAVWKRNEALREQGLPAGDPTAKCLLPGMPRMMKMDLPMEVIVTPRITYVYGAWDSQFRRIFTDGRAWPEELLDTFNGYSIGEWHDENGDGVYDMLSVETRALRGPRVFDARAVPFHDNNKTVVREEIRLVDSRTLEDKITTIDGALTRPWTIAQRYIRKTDRIVWKEHLCVEGKWYLTLGDDWYIFDPATETLAPARKGQPPLVPAPN
jgi:hypothetical protein